ncbi:hypothetical protein PsorP6_002918 [Peronosclerospora sorghi]|uniref:Uncharacterized protein n=1 Tax=Peronosclerospora sorghi TaxID=230839 RepID=A0ACC0VKK9_9STRA|nr:hypothetical protein PsorP6_002918 [Peronosclerospora sorghi]
MMLIAKPEHLEAVLKTQFDFFPKSQYIHDVFFHFLGDNIVVTNDQMWKRQRSIMLQLFSTGALREHMTPIVQRYTGKLVDMLADAAAQKTPLDVFNIGFGAKMNSMNGASQPFSDAISQSSHLVANRFKLPMWYWKLLRWLNVGDEHKIRKDVQVIDETILGFIADAIERRRLRTTTTAYQPEAHKNKDIISIVLDMMELEGVPLNTVTVRNIALASIIAGRDTTANPMGWFFHVLSQNPQVETKLRDEILANIPELRTDKHYIPSIEDISKVPYLEASILEGLRLYPPVPLIATHCIKDTVLPDGTFVPAKTDVGIAVFSSGRLASVWGHDALEFKPERFLDDAGALIPMSATTFAAFSAGPRICVG